jgi:hypothetical protein
MLRRDFLRTASVSPILPFIYKPSNNITTTINERILNDKRVWKRVSYINTDPVTPFKNIYTPHNIIDCYSNYQNKVYSYHNPNDEEIFLPLFDTKINIKTSDKNLDKIIKLAYNNFYEQVRNAQADMLEHRYTQEETFVDFISIIPDYPIICMNIVGNHYNFVGSCGVSMSPWRVLTIHQTTIDSKNIRLDMKNKSCGPISKRIYK